MRTNRLTIPKVNENPRPPNEARMGKQGHGDGHGRHQGGGHGRHGGGHGRHGGHGGGHGDRGGEHGRHMGGALRQLSRLERKALSPPPLPKQVARTTPLTRGNIQKRIGKLGNNPANALAFSSFVPGEGQVDPRDAEYWNNVSNLLFETQRSYSQGLLEQGRSDRTYNENVRTLGVNQSRDDRSLAEEAMRSNLGQSGWLSREATEQTYDYTKQRGDLLSGYTDEKTDRSSAMSAAIQEYINAERGQALGATQRYGEAQQQAALGGPMYDPRVIRKINRILDKTVKRKGRRRHHR